MFGIVTAPLDQLLVPALLWIEDPILTSGFSRLLLVVPVGLLILASPFFRERRAALLLGAGVAATFVAVWIARIYVSPRFVSYLLAPLLILLASGTARLLARPTRRPSAGTVLAVTVLAVTAVAFISAAAKVMRLPREAHRDAIEAILRRAPGTVPVFAYTYEPTDLAFYLGRPVRALEHSEVASHVCGSRQAVVYVTQPLGTRPVVVPCLHALGVRHTRFVQYSRGGEINVWFIPAAR